VTPEVNSFVKGGNTMPVRQISRETHPEEFKFLDKIKKCRRRGRGKWVKTPAESLNAVTVAKSYSASPRTKKWTALAVEDPDLKAQ